MKRIHFQIIKFSIIIVLFSISNQFSASVYAYSDGWYQEDGYWCYYLNDSKVTGWLDTNGNWYYFDNDGYMQTGWIDDGGYTYYLDQSGALTYGWIEWSDGWYYTNSSGCLIRNVWYKIGGYWYYFDETGKMATGWLSDGGTWYYLNNSGDMQQGWLLDGDYYYYCDRSSGAMQTDTYVNGIWIYSDGTAEDTDYANEKIPVMIRANEVVKSLCNPDDALEYKKLVCYEWVAAFPYVLKDYPIGNYYNSGKWACYDAHYANNILNAYGDQSVLGAECVGEAAALAYLYNELSFGTVYLDHSDMHGWIEVNGLYYDPLLEEEHKDGLNWMGISPSAYSVNTAPFWVEL